MLWSLAFIAPFSVIATDLPRMFAFPLALAAMAWAIFDARRYRVVPARGFTIAAGCLDTSCDGERIHALQLDWRGPLAFLCWRDAQGRRHRASFWPDTLSGGMRRELSIALRRREAASGAASMAG